MKRTAIAAAAAAAALAWLPGCGSEQETPQATLRPMGATAPAARAETNTPPVIESLRFDPSSPTPGLPVRAPATAVRSCSR
jgi:hypothetical protein